MTRTRFVLNSLLYHWRTNLAVLLGVVAAAMVIGGALFVGDSVRGSLRQMSLDRLGRIDFALNSPRFFREDLANEMAASPEFQKLFDAPAPAIVMEGGLDHVAGDQTRRAGNVNVYGVDDRLWNMTEHGTIPVPDKGKVVLSAPAGEQLGVTAGDTVELSLEIPTSIPRDTLLGERDEVLRGIMLTVQAVLPPRSGAGRFELNPNQQLPLNAFVSLEGLQDAIGLAHERPSRRDPEGKLARVNALFLSARSAPSGMSADAIELAQDAADVLARSLSLDDLLLMVRLNEQHKYLSLESKRMILEPGVIQAGRKAAQSLGMKVSPVFVYLANEIRNAKEPSKYSMYSIIAGVDWNTLEDPPFGPFEFVGDQKSVELGEGAIQSGGPGEIVLNEWLATDLGVNVGDDVLVKYHLVGSHGELPEEELRFLVKGIVKLDSTAADRGFTPEVKGITDVDTFAEWDQPFPMKLGDVTDRDDEYWTKYRATPKAFVTLKTAQYLWQSRYGTLTSLRLAAEPGKTLEESAADFRRELLDRLDPMSMGLAFQPVKSIGLQAAAGTTDFSGLFIGFSFFLILSAMILIGLLFRLGIERRAASLGLLSAVGFTPGQIRGLFLTQGFILAALGGLLGTLAGVAYGWLMLYGLRTWWNKAVGTTFLELYVTPKSLAIGYGTAVVVAMLAVVWALRMMRTLSTRELLSGSTQPEQTAMSIGRRGRRATRVGAVSALLVGIILVASLAGLVPASEAFSGLSWQIVAFFVMGIALLTASLAFLSSWLDSDKSAAVRGRGMAGLLRLGMRNASRHRQRSVFTTGLIASATFVIVAVGAGRRNPIEETPNKQSGNGGFTLLAESAAPILHDMNTAEGRRALNLPVGEGSPEAKLLDQIHVEAFQVQPGEDASCLNLYQTRLPTILGVPDDMIERGGFKFIGATGNPWNQLKQTDPSGAIPVFGDMNTLMYSLHKGVGDTIAVPDDEHPDYVLRIDGMLDGSVFQGVLLMSQANFQKLYPEQGGYRYFLIETPSGSAEEVSDILETNIPSLDVEPVTQRLANFLAVQNTYLQTFQALGGLGLLLGTLGLAAVMLRNVLERRSELALLRAVGFEKWGLAILVMCENAFLLLWGLAAGTISALLAMAPHLLSTGADVQWGAGVIVLAGVFLIGMLAAFAAVREATRTPVVATLRSE